jgi:predicted RNA-binding protein YlxR (DUF448 family)
VVIDPTGKRSGRGAYVCDASACWQTALKRGILPRALKLESVPEHDLRTLTEFAEQLSSRDSLAGAASDS